MKALILGLIAFVGIGFVTRGLFQHYIIAEVTTDHATTEEEGHTYIIGTIKNNCDRTFSHVTVLFKLDHGALPGAFETDAPVYAYGSDVKSGDIRQVKSFNPISSSATYRFDSINAY
jgi:hypothetical protein